MEKNVLTSFYFFVQKIFVFVQIYVEISWVLVLNALFCQTKHLRFLRNIISLEETAGTEQVTPDADQLLCFLKDVQVNH